MANKLFSLSLSLFVSLSVVSCSFNVREIVAYLWSNRMQLVLVPYRYFSVIVIAETICISFDFFPCVLYYIKLHYITLSYYMVYASLLSLLQLFFCLHVCLLYVIKYYLLTYFSATFQVLKCEFFFVLIQGGWCVEVNGDSFHTRPRWTGIHYWGDSLQTATPAAVNCYCALAELLL